MTDATWVKVSSNSDFPNGLWLVKTKDGGVQVFDNASQHPNVKTIGHYFSFDEKSQCIGLILCQHLL